MIKTSGLKDFNLFENDITDEAFDYYSKQSVLSCDTETRGLVIPRDRLCLIQLCDKNDVVSVVRFASKEAFQKKSQNLVKLLEDEKILKLFHFARFDIAVIKQYLKCDTNNVFCTKIASKLVRTYTDRHSLKELTYELLKISLDKSNQTSDWASSELTDSQIEYACNDVKVLIPIYEKIIAMLERENLKELSFELSRALKVVTQADLLGYHSIFEH